MFRSIHIKLSSNILTDESKRRERSLHKVTTARSERFDINQGAISTRICIICANIYEIELHGTDTRSIARHTCSD